MAIFSYHSGVPVEFVENDDLREIRGLAPGPDLLVQGEWGNQGLARLAYLVREARPSAAAAISTTPAPGATFWVHFWSSQWRPNHRVTIRCAEAGWTRDIYGMYRYGGWHYELSKATFPSGITMKLVLNGMIWMTQPNQALSQENNHHFAENEVSFTGSESRIAIPYENLVSDAGREQQESVRSNISQYVEYDVIVIGSGMGGGILADQLSDRGVRTLVLEVGGISLSSHMHNLPGDWVSLPARHQVSNFENAEGSQFLFGVQMNLGGRSIFWSGLIPRMQEWELASWPASVGDYLRSGGYAQAERLMRARQSLGEFQDRLIADLAGQFAEYHVLALPRSHHQPDGTDSSTGTFSTADVLLNSFAYGGPAGRENLTLNLNHLVTRIETDGSQAVAVLCHDLEGNVQRRYVGREIVLCAGSLESPRIALQSGLADTNGRIGRGLTDHPAYFSHPEDNYGYEIPLTLADGSPHPYGSPEGHAAILLQHRNASSEQHAFNVEILVNAWYWDLRNSDDELRRQILGMQNRARVKFTFIFDSPLDDGNWLALQGSDRRIVARVAPNEAGRGFHEECKQLRNEILTVMRVPNPDPGQDLGYGNQGTPHHAGGSLRMSGDGTGVVDGNLKFESYENLYACDVSVFPSIPCANPSLTLAALALRLSDHLATKLGR